VTGDLATFADRRVSLDLHEGAYLSLVSDLTSIQIDKF
jgi:hypothetical protein